MVTSNRTISINFSGQLDIPNLAFPAAENEDSPGLIDLITLASGANTITVPTGFTGVTIIFPDGNAVLVTLKGVTGDTGVPLHKTDPTSIGLDSTEASFCLSAAAEIVGVRLIWT